MRRSSAAMTRTPHAKSDGELSVGSEGEGEDCAIATFHEIERSKFWL